MAITLRNVKGSALSHSELDANFQRLIDLEASSGSSLVGFIQSGAGAVARTVQAKERDIVSIKDFKNNDGTQVIGNDVQDEATGFQAAHDALPASGGAIYLSQTGSKYLINTKVTITKPVHLFGDGWSSVVRTSSTAITAIFEVNAGGNGSIFQTFRIEGGKSASGGTVQRGIYFNGAKDGLVQHVNFSGPNSTTGLNIGVDINGVSSGRTKVLYNRFERMVSSTGNGTAVLIELSNFNHVIGNVVDGTEFNNADGGPGAAISLTAEVGGVGSVDNVIAYNRVHDHKQVGISMNSTTYFEFAGNLGACDRNLIAFNDVYNSSSVNGGDASSGIHIVGNSNDNRIVGNKVHHNGHATAGGYGIVVSGSAQGTANPGQPKLDESPTRNEVLDNDVYLNKDQGIWIKGANSSIVRGNRVYENGQRTANTFQNMRITLVGGTVTGNNSMFVDNICLGTQPIRQLEIEAGISNVAVMGNYLPNGGTDAIAGGDATTQFGWNHIAGKQTLGGVAAALVGLTGMITSTTTFDPPNLLNGTQTTTTMGLTGAALGDIVAASFSLSQQGIQITAYVSSVDSVTVVFKNDTGGAIDLASGTIRARIWKQ